MGVYAAIDREGYIAALVKETFDMVLEFDAFVKETVGMVLDVLVV